MVLDQVQSVSKKMIRVTEERWLHIVENHTEIAGLRQEVLETVFNPDFIVKGAMSELFAVRFYSSLGNNLVVVYREGGVDGFIVTAFRVRNIKPYLRKKIIWKNP